MSGRPSLRRRCAAALEELWICLWGWIPTPVGTLLRLAAWRWCFAACGSARFATGVALLGCRHMRFGNGVRIGRGCFLSAEDGKLELADEAALSPHVHVGADHGLIRIGRQTAIGPGTVIRAANHRFADVSRPIMRQGHDYGEIVIEMTGDSFGAIIVLIVILQLSLIVNAIIYARLAYKKFIGIDDDIEYRGLIYMIVIFSIYLLASVFFNYLLEDWFGGSFIKSRLTSSAWLALALGIGIAVVYYKEDELENSFYPYAAAQKQERYEGTEENRVAIVSQYPWENVSPRFLTLHKGANTFIKMEYEYQGVFMENNVFPEKKGDKIMLTGDVLLKAGWYEYVIENARFVIPYLNYKGNADKIYLNDIPFRPGDLSNAEFLMRSVKVLHEDNTMDERLYNCHI